MDHVVKASKILKDGGIVIFPTDTAFGIGCRVDDEEAVKRLFQLRRRPKTQATPVLISSLRMAEDFLLPVPKDVLDKLIEPYWPGALTIILYCKTEKVPELVRGGRSMHGVRIPDHMTTLALIDEVGTPILGPSANFHGGKTPFIFADLDPELVKLVDYVIPGECYQKEASTVIDTTVIPWQIVRQGAVTIKNL
ncbi:MAG: L-threonylcarbamoyladenylate synthase [Candidatus Levyibacteriota bacterium]